MIRAPATVGGLENSMPHHTTKRPWAIPIVLVILLFHHPPCMAQSGQPGDAPLATVNGVAITARDLHVEIDQLTAEMRLRNQTLSEARLQGMRGQIVENLIDREVLHQQAQLSNIQVRPQSVEEALAELGEKMGGAAALRSYMSAAGITPDQLRERLRKGLAIQQLLRREAVRGIRVGDAEMRAFYRRHPEFFSGGERIRARHLLVAVKNPNDECQRAAALQRIRQLQVELAGGVPLAVLALEHSECPSKSRGGDLGYLTRDEMVAAFSAAVDPMQPGKISDVVATGFGYHLIQVLDRKPPVQITYKKARAKIERTLRRNKENAAVRAYVAGLKKQAEIVRFGDTSR